MTIKGAFGRDAPSQKKPVHPACAGVDGAQRETSIARLVRQHGSWRRWRLWGEVMHPFHAIRPLNIRHAGLYEVHAAGTQTKARVLVVKLTTLGVGAAAAAQQRAYRVRDIGVLLLAQINGQVGKDSSAKTSVLVQTSIEKLQKRDKPRPHRAQGPSQG